jgi:hypothetical protein
MAPGETRNADRRGRNQSGQGTEDKAAWWISTEACDRRCVSNVGEDVGCDEYVDLEARQVSEK